MRRTSLLAIGLALALTAPAAADGWKDESGQGRGGDRRGEWRPDRDWRGPDRRDDRQGQVPWPWAAPRIPQGHMPPPGECRVWYPGVPAGQQPPLGRC
jgi:hypothetical protein